MKRTKSFGSFLTRRGRTAAAADVEEPASKKGDTAEDAGASSSSAEQPFSSAAATEPVTALKSTSKKNLKKSKSAAGLTGAASGSRKPGRSSSLASFAKNVLKFQPVQQEQFLVRVTVTDSSLEHVENVKVFSSTSMAKEVSATGGKALPHRIRDTNTATYNGLRGCLHIPGFDPIEFSAGSGAVSGGMFSRTRSGNQTAFVGEPGRTKFTALGAPSWDWRDAFSEKPEEGHAAELEIFPCWRGDFADIADAATSPPQRLLLVKIRKASATELKRRLQLQAMREACDEGNYDSLVAQIAKARVAGCLLADIDKAEMVVKKLKSEGKHVNEGCSHEALREMMQWDKVTSTKPASLVKEEVDHLPDNSANMVFVAKTPSIAAASTTDAASASCTASVADESCATTGSVLAEGEEVEPPGTSSAVVESSESVTAAATEAPADEAEAAACSFTLKKLKPGSVEGANHPPDYYNTILRDNTPCTASANCACNVHENPGEVLEFIPNAIQDCLGKWYGKNADEILFRELVESALAVEEGSVWKAGGKLIFSAFDRNQSMVALQRQLERAGRRKCADMMLKLCAYCEKKYAPGYVTAVQCNFHPSPNSYHDQHRDIYSGKQRAGPNCTCSFRECVGTVCFSLGSSRVCTMETLTDEFSHLLPCGDSCEGRTERVWLHSGSSMYFNAEWNANHNHGIPKMDQDCGPRISIAYLMGAK
ncbi:unnamed protein product [Amoebophrya sp. A120]|nr:unnamed protein product [Amoebophrya sp. A120]|eukprot:GSA120T00005560001.1